MKTKNKQKAKAVTISVLAWDFVELHYPNYSSSDQIAYADDLQKIVDGELNGDALKIFNKEFGGNALLAKEMYNKVYREIYEVAIISFLEKERATAIERAKHLQLIKNSSIGR